MAAAATLVAQADEPLDALLWRAAGLGPEAIPDVLAVNPDLSARLTLSAGDQVLLPARTTNQPTRPVVHLWS